MVANPSTSTRKTFNGADDLLLLARVERTTPWRLRSGVMELWLQMAQALNADAACSLSGLNAAAVRARFFRLVTQRREGQDKMLRRGVADEAQLQSKLALLDRVIARMDADDEESAIHHLLENVGDDAHVDVVGVALPFALPARPVPTAAKPQQQPTAKQTKQQAQVQLQLSSQQVPPQMETSFHALTRQPMGLAQPVVTSSYGPNLPFRHAASTATQRRPSIQRPASSLVVQRTPPLSTTVVIPTDSPVNNTAPSFRPSGVEPPTKKRAVGAKKPAPSTGMGLQGLESLFSHALEYMQRKLELDQEAAEVDRAWRSEEARARVEEMKTMRDQTDRLIHAVLELARSK